MSADRCYTCGAKLGGKEVIFVAKSEMFCTDQCGMIGTNISDQDEWDSIKDTINPLEIGIKPACAWCSRETSERTSSTIGLLCFGCNETYMNN